MEGGSADDCQEQSLPIGNSENLIVDLKIDLLTKAKHLLYLQSNVLDNLLYNASWPLFFPVQVRTGHCFSNASSKNLSRITFCG